MLHPDEIIVDLFAGGGGASSGIEAALEQMYRDGLLPTRRHIDLAVNHDPEAIAMHEANHPHTKHLCNDVWRVHPDSAQAMPDRPVGLLWASPDCKHFSKAKGGKPVEKKIRDLAWVVVLWARVRQPRIIMLENVEEFQTWGPLKDAGDGKALPDPEQRGRTFKKFVRELRRFGYKVEWKELRACDYGAPTIRKRLYLIARCDGEKIVWPKPTHAKNGAGGLLPWRSAAECIDWSIPCPSIFERKRPLKEATLRRIARGVMRYVVDNPNPFIVPVTHTQGGNTSRDAGDPLATVTTAKGGELAVVAPVISPLTHHDAARANAASDPLRTVTGANRGEQALIAPIIARVDQTSAADRAGIQSAEDPLRTIATAGGMAIAAATMIQTGYGERDGQAPRALDIEQPLGTVVASGKHALVSAHVTKFRGGATGHDAREPLHTITAGGDMKRDAGAPHALGVVSAFLTKFSENSIGTPPQEPLHTAMAGAPRHGVVTAFMAQHNAGPNNENLSGREASQPISTISTKGSQQQLVAVALSHQYGSNTNGGDGDPSKPAKTVTAQGGHHALVAANLMVNTTGHSGAAMDEPIPTVTTGNHHAEVRAFLIKYYGTAKSGQPVNEPLHSVTAKDRLGLVTVHGVEYAIVDIGMRMLTPRELFNAQGFPASYIIDPELNGKKLTKTSQVARCGNSVCPDMSQALCLANLMGEATPVRKAA